MTLSDRIRARNGDCKYWQDGMGPTSINVLADKAAVRLDRLQEALSDLAVRHWSGFTCVLCGAAADSCEKLVHNPDCLMNENQ